MKRIGVTINIKSTLFSNGVNQNALYLARVLKECGYIVDLICGSEKTINEIKNYEKKINITNLENSYEIRYDLIIQLGFTVEKVHFNKWKENNDDLKFVAYECGNHYLINTEKILFKKDEDSVYFRNMYTLNQKPDQVWTIPQMENTNYTFYQFITGQDNVTAVPFIWDPFVIEESFRLRGKDVFTPRKMERCSIMEPNISVMKNVVLPVVIFEKNQKINPLKNIYLFGSDVIKTSKPFVDFVLSTEIGKNKIVSAESRYPTAKILPDHTDFVFSWQWENNLNYLWFDVAWMGYPIIHNGSMCQDIGYYYEGFNGEEAQEKINQVIKTHNDNFEIYIKKNRENIKRYTKENQTLIDQYKDLVENVLNDKFERKNYKWEENKIY
jgi:hypothetical protein